MKLSTKSLLLILVLFAVIAVAVSVLSARMLYDSLSDEYRSKGEAIARALVDAGTETLVNRDLATVQAAVDQFVESDGVAYVYITDAGGDIVSHTFVPAVPTQIIDLTEAPHAMAQSGDPEAINLNIDGLGEVIHIHAPMLAGAAGYVHVGMDLSFIRDHIRAVVVQQQLLFAVIFLLAALAAVSFTRRIARPISLLAGYTRNLSARDFSEEVNIPPQLQKTAEASGDEVGQLTRAYIEMEQTLRRYLEDLKRTTATKQRIESELNIAHDIQMSLVPRTFPAYPEQPEFDLHASLVPAREVGGDFYDFFFVDANRLCIAIADVSDKGVPASLFMALTRTLLRTVGRDPDTDPAAIMARMNEDISSDNDSCMFVTAFCGFLDIRSGVLSYCNAGHDPPLLLRDGEVELLPSTAGVALGMSEQARYSLDEVQLQPDDLLFLYTDGITEAMDPEGQAYGRERLMNLLRLQAGQHACDALLNRVVAAVREHARDAAQSDDMTLLALSYQGASERRSLLPEWRISAADPEALARLERYWNTVTENGVLPESVVFRGRLVLEELVLNIIKHGQRDSGQVTIEVRIEQTGDGLGFEIRDNGRAFDPASIDRPDTDAALDQREPGGLGLHLVQNMVRQFRYRRDDEHNVVSFLLPTGDDAGQ